MEVDIQGRRLLVDGGKNAHRRTQPPMGSSHNKNEGR